MVRPIRTEELEEKLLAAARALSPSDRVPFAFEKRIMAALPRPESLDLWALWARVLWRAAAPCVAVMLAVSVWAAVADSANGSNLALDLDRTVWAPFASLNESW